MSDELAEAAAKIIDPDAWHKTLPTDGCGIYWIGRRNVARQKARAAIAVVIERCVDAITPHHHHRCDIWPGGIGHCTCLYDYDEVRPYIEAIRKLGESE